MKKLSFCIGLALLWSPVVALALVGREPLQWSLLSGRQLGLLAHSLGYAVAVGALCSAAGLLVALRLWRIGATRNPLVQSSLVALIALPTTVLATSWMGISGGSGGWWTQGWIPSILVQTLALSPLSVCVVALSLERLDGDVLDAARVARHPSHQFWGVLLPMMWPALAASASLAALVALGDFTVPSLFGANPYALEIFAMFSAGEDAVSACWPLALLSFPLAWVAGKWTSTLVAVRGARRTARSEAPQAIEGLSRFATGALGLAFLSACLLLVLQSRSVPEAFATVSSSSGELSASLRFAGIGALLAVAIGLATAPMLVHLGNPAAWALVLAPVALPPALVGMGLARVGVATYGHWGTEAFLSLGPALAVAIRFAPFAAAIIALEWARVDPLVFDAGRMFARPVKRTARLWIPLMAGGVGAGFALSFAMGLGELGATLLVVPPGQSTLSIRLYNLLHYGAAEDVAALALMLATVTLGVAMLSGLALSRARTQE